MRRLLHRLAWSGPLLTSPDEPEHRVAMARAAAYLYGGGAVLAFLSLPLLEVRGAQAAVAAVALGAIVAVVFHVVTFDRLPPALFPLSTAYAIGLVTFAVAATGEAGTAYTLFYLWAILWAFFFYGLALALLQLGFVAAGFAVLVVLGGEVGLADAVIGVGTLGVLGLGVLLLKSRLVRLVRGLSGAEERYRLLVEQLPLVTYANDFGGRTTYISPQIEALGYGADDWLGDPGFFASILHPDDRESVVADVEAARTSRGRYSGEYRLLARDGSVVWFLDETISVHDASGEPHFRQGFLLDVTRQKRAEEQQKHLEDELRQSLKMESIGRLAGGVAHDFNNLLTAILGYTQLALERPAARADARLASSLEQTGHAAERAADLTRQLLAFSRKQVLQPRTLNVNAVVDGLTDLLLRVIGEDVEVVTEFDPGLEPVRADPGQLEQVLVNLAVNARDAMPSGGRLGISTSMATVGSRVAGVQPPLAPGRYAVLTVSDGGIGLEPGSEERIFEPFFTTKPVGEGTGLGLSTVYGIVFQTGGSIGVDSRPGEGTTFRIFLPVVDDAPAPPELADPVAPPGSETILLVEDDTVVRELLVEMLGDSGYTVVDAADAAAALELSESLERIDLLLTDVVMPRMSGREVAQKVRTRHPEARLVYMSGYTGGALHDQGVVADSAVFLQKPFSAAQLTAKLREVLGPTPEETRVEALA